MRQREYPEDPTGRVPADYFCANCGEPIAPGHEAAEVYSPAEGEVTSRLVHVSCMRLGEEIA